MTQDSFGVICLCAQFKKEPGIFPLTTAEFRDLSLLLAQRGKTPGALFYMTSEDLLSMGLSPEGAHRVLTLLDRAPVVETMVGSYRSMGVHILTPCDSPYSPTMRATLTHSCPPVLCCAGNLSLWERKTVGFVGARDISPEDAKFATNAVQKVLAQGYSIVSGGARGSDSVSEKAALWEGGTVVEFPAVPLLRKLRDPNLIPYLEGQQLLLATPAAPHAGFSSALASTRNRMIYAHSVSTVVVRATQCSGGTWSGASEALKRQLCPILCRDLPYAGSQGLIRAGAIAIDDSWDGLLPNGGIKHSPLQEHVTEIPEQFFLF